MSLRRHARAWRIRVVGPRRPAESTSASRRSAGTLAVLIPEVQATGCARTPRAQSSLHLGFLTAAPAAARRPSARAAPTLPAQLYFAHSERLAGARRLHNISTLALSEESPAHIHLPPICVAFCAPWHPFEGVAGAGARATTAPPPSRLLRRRRLPCRRLPPGKRARRPAARAWATPPAQTPAASGPRRSATAPPPSPAARPTPPCRRRGPGHAPHRLPGSRRPWRIPLTAMGAWPAGDGKGRRTQRPARDANWCSRTGLQNRPA